MFRTRRKANRYRNFGLLLLLASCSTCYLGFKTGYALLFLVGCGLSVCTFPLFQRYRIWSSGAKGEEKVAKHLKSLGRGFHVFHDVALSRTKGDIDHVVVGASGVFVIETKNNNGTISCNGDSWSQWKTGKKGGGYKGKLGSPSRQAKRNASRLANLIGRRLHNRPYVNAIVVFANKKAVLNLKNPTVAVLRPQELSDYITNYDSAAISSKYQKQLAQLIQHYSRYN